MIDQFSVGGTCFKHTLGGDEKVYAIISFSASDPSTGVVTR